MLVRNDSYKSVALNYWLNDHLDKNQDYNYDAPTIMYTVKTWCMKKILCI